MAVRYERTEHIAVITLDRPGSLNAMNEALTRELREAWQRFAEDEDAYIAVLTGAGRAFCAGMDMKEAAEALRAGGEMKLTRIPSAAEIAKPAIAAVNGSAAGGGVSMILSCDIAVCADDAQFVLPFTARGRNGASLALQLARRTSVSAALYMALSASRIDAGTALRFGIVHEVLPKDEVLPRVLELAERMAGHSRPAARTMKRALHGFAASLGDDIVPDGPAETEIALGADLREGTLAFDEKRRARFGDA